MDWPTVDAFSDELRRLLNGQNLRGLPPISVAGTDDTLEPDLMARIVLADIDHCRQWDDMHPETVTSPNRLQDLATESQRLLNLC